MYSKGDIVWVRFPFSDLSKSKLRPALVLSNDRINSTGDYILAQITSKVKDDGLSIVLHESSSSQAPLKILSSVRPYKVFTLNDSLIASKQTAVKEQFLSEVQHTLVSYFLDEFTDLR